jgi:predicted patatin/cPLA2 family phospholipase
VFQIKVQNILDAYSKKGLFDVKTIEKCFKPLFDAKDISININMLDFYKLTNIEIHFFSFEINEYVVTDISYLTHPDLELMTAIQMTCGLPVLVTPVCIDNKCFIDGGMASNYPLKNCIDSGKNENEILGFKNKYNENNNNINEESNLLDFLLNFLYKAIFSISNREIKTTVKNEILFDADYLSIDVLQNALNNIEVRKEFFKNGAKCATDFFEKFMENNLDLELHNSV